MANIKTHLDKIKNALFGQEVRGSIHDGIDAINKEVEGTTEKQNKLGEQFKNLVINEGNSNAEVAASRGSHDWLPDRLDNFDSQLEHSVRQARYKGNGDNRPIVSFIDDDGKKEVFTRLLPIMKAKDIKFGGAIITSFIGSNSAYMTLEQLKECQSHMEALSHMVDVETHILDGYTEYQQRYQLEESQKWLNSQGFKCEGVVFPQNTSDATVRSIANDYYTYQTGELGFNDINFINTIAINRIAYGSWENGNPDLNDLDKTSLAYAKACVDKCLNEKSWLIFMLHIANQPISKDSELGELIDYIKAKGIEILPPGEAFKVKGNNFVLGTEDNEYIKYNKGKFKSNVLNYKIFNTDEVGVDTDITYFEKGKTSICNISSSNPGFPTSGGILETYCSKDWNGYSYQIFKSLDTSNSYRRQYNGSTWDVFKKENGDSLIILEQNGVTNNTSPSEYPKNLSYCRIQASDQGFPAPNGVLITQNSISNQGWQIQTFIQAESNNTWQRTSVWGDTWTSWQDMVPKFKKLIVNMPTTTVNANDYVDVKINIQGLTPGGSTVQANPLWGIDVPNLIYNSFVSEADMMTIRLFNLNSVNKTLTARNWAVITDM